MALAEDEARKIPPGIIFLLGRRVSGDVDMSTITPINQNSADQALLAQQAAASGGSSLFATQLAQVLAASQTSQAQATPPTQQAVLQSLNVQAAMALSQGNGPVFMTLETMIALQSAANPTSSAQTPATGTTASTVATSSPVQSKASKVTASNASTSSSATATASNASVLSSATALSSNASILNSAAIEASNASILISATAQASNANTLNSATAQAEASGGPDTSSAFQTVITDLQTLAKDFHALTGDRSGNVLDPVFGHHVFGRHGHDSSHRAFSQAARSRDGLDIA
jgi:hypothetical protein